MCYVQKFEVSIERKFGGKENFLDLECVRMNNSVTIRLLYDRLITLLMIIRLG